MWGGGSGHDKQKPALCGFSNRATAYLVNLDILGLLTLVVILILIIATAIMNRVAVTIVIAMMIVIATVILNVITPVVVSSTVIFVIFH